MRLNDVHPIQAYIEQYTRLSQEDARLILSFFHEKKIAKEERLLKEGQVCRHLFFLEKGLLRYFVVKEGVEITKFFTDAPYMFTSQQSFTSVQPARENITAIEDSVIWQISLEDATALLTLSSWNTFVRKLVQEVQFYTEQLLEEMQTETAENRYCKLLSTNPEFVQRIPLKYLASYFGIAPQSLSRIRKNLAGKT